MTQQKHLVCNTRYFPWFWFPLQGMIWISSIGILSGSIANAQAPSEIITPAALEPPPTPVAPEAMPQQSVSEDNSVTAFPRALPDPTASLRDAYIAPTDYSIGATNGYHEPNAVVANPQNFGSGRIGAIAVGSKRVPTNGAIANEQNGYVSSRFSGSHYTASRSTPSSVIAFNSTTTTQVYGDRASQVIPRLRNSNLRLIFPLSIPASITSLFGWRIHPISGAAKFHSGVDLGAPLGTPVLAAYAGQVMLADWLGGYGLAIALGHKKDTQETLYAHLSEILVKPGQWVSQGQLIGRVGSTGNSTGPHLHFEFRQLTAEGWVAMNPGTQLEFAIAQLVKALQVAKAPTQSKG